MIRQYYSLLSDKVAKPRGQNLFILPFVVFIVCFLLLYLLLVPEDPYKCCRSSTKATLPSILETKPVKDKAIFFHEGFCSCERSDKIVITARQACAVESAAKLNPNFEIYLLYVSPGIIKNEGTESDHFLQALGKYKNVKIRHLDIEEYVEYTPAHDFRKRRPYYATSLPKDFLKFITLWRYGGIVLDLDTVQLRSLENLPLNFAAAETDSLASASAFSFRKTGTGHVMVRNCLKNLQQDYLQANGSTVLTNLIQHICASESIGDIVGTTCMDFTVYPSSAFSPIAKHNWTMLFYEEVETVNVFTEDSYMIRLWDDVSHSVKIPRGLKTPYTNFAQKYCPLVYQQTGNFF